MTRCGLLPASSTPRPAPALRSSGAAGSGENETLVTDTQAVGVGPGVELGSCTFSVASITAPFPASVKTCVPFAESYIVNTILYCPVGTSSGS